MSRNILLIKGFCAHMVREIRKKTVKKKILNCYRAPVTSFKPLWFFFPYFFFVFNGY